MILTKNNIDSVDIDFEIDQKIKTKKLNELLLIVPTNRKIRYLKKEIISLSPGKTTRKLNIETIGTFSSKILFIDSSSNERTLSEAAAAVLLKQSFHEITPEYFSHYKEEVPSGTLERVKNVISEYKKHGISPAHLFKESEKLSGAEKIKAKDIAKIYEIYQKKCRDLNVYETGDIYDEINKFEKEEFNKRFRELYPDINFVVINGFDEFTSHEIEIINSTADIEEIRLFLSFDYYIYNPLIFSHLDKCYKKLSDKNFKIVKDKSEAEFEKFRRIIREKLFLQKEKDLIKDYKEKIKTIKAETRENEIEIISKEIKELITQKDVEPHKICVVFNLISKYSPVVRDNFSVYGIPFNLTDRFHLHSSYPVISIINFLEISENDFYYKNIFRALSSGFINIPEIDISNLLKASVNLKIISGYENWQNILKEAINKTIDPEEEEFYNSFNNESYRKALDDINRIYEFLKPFRKKMSVKEFYKSLTENMNLLDIHSTLVNSPQKDFAIEENIKGLTVFIETIKELLKLLEMENGEEKKYPLKFFLKNIRTAVNNSRFNIKEKPDYGVQVTTLNEIRGLQFDYLFIAGLNDGDFPTRYMPEIFFSGSYLRDELNHHTEERYHFYQSLCSWKKGLYLSHPSREETREVSESTFLTEFKNLFDTENISNENFNASLYSKEELLVYAGTPGRNYLKNRAINDEINFEDLNKAILVDKLRVENPFGENEFTGFIKEKISDKAKEELERIKLNEFSVSQLESYAKCPFQYFANRILKLKPVEEPTEEIEALEMGSILHNIFYLFYSELKKRGIKLQNSPDEIFAEAEKLIFDIAKQKIEEANFNSPLSFYEKEKIMGINGNKKNSILYKFLIDEREKAEGFTPFYFEINFGQKSDIFSLKNDFRAGNVKVRGKIDRIDLNENSEKYKVVDYKLGGRKPSQDDLKNGISLQLPLYMYASKILINAQLEKDYNPESAQIYSLKFKEGEFGRKEVKSINSKMIEETLNTIEKYVNEIAEGKFHLSKLIDREKKVCLYCNFKPICRIQELN